MPTTTKTVKKINIIILSVLFLMACTAEPKKNKFDNTALPLIESFFSLVQKKDADRAITQVFKAIPNLNPQDSSSVDVKNKFIQLNENNGRYRGYTILKKKFIEQDLAIYSCLAKYETSYYRFIFIFYNNGENIMLYRFKFDSEIDEELEGALKFYS